tara:strand:+ start:107 stop:520 length:414 start_codon:yes stop_codon:yes gene_type:complete
MKIGFTCSAFDLLHAGHIIMLEDCKSVCDYLIVGIQSNPNLDRDYKNQPVQSLTERIVQIDAVKYVDEIFIYHTEKDLHNWLNENVHNIDIRILGSDWKNKKYTGHELDIPIYFHERNHNYSSTELIERIKNKFNQT